MNMQRYEQFLRKAEDELCSYRVDKVKMWLGLAKTRREVLGIPESADEMSLRIDLEEFERDYAPPPGLRRREGVAGCGDPNCEDCYEPETSPRRSPAVGR